MTFKELADFDSSSIKRGDEALKIEWVDRNAQRESAKLEPFDTPGAMLADHVRALVEGFVAARFTVQRMDRILAALPSASDATIAKVAADLGIDLDIVVPADIASSVTVG